MKKIILLLFLVGRELFCLGEFYAPATTQGFSMNTGYNPLIFGATTNFASGFGSTMPFLPTITNSYPSTFGAPLFSSMTNIPMNSYSMNPVYSSYPSGATNFGQQNFMGQAQPYSGSFQSTYGAGQAFMYGSSQQGFTTNMPMQQNYSTNYAAPSQSLGQQYSGQAGYKADYSALNYYPATGQLTPRSEAAVAGAYMGASYQGQQNQSFGYGQGIVQAGQAQELNFDIPASDEVPADLSILIGDKLEALREVPLKISFKTFKTLSNLTEDLDKNISAFSESIIGKISKSLGTSVDNIEAIAENLCGQVMWIRYWTNSASSMQQLFIKSIGASSPQNLQQQTANPSASNVYSAIPEKVFSILARVGKEMEASLKGSDIFQGLSQEYESRCALRAFAAAVILDSQPLYFNCFSQSGAFSARAISDLEKSLKTVSVNARELIIGAIADYPALKIFKEDGNLSTITNQVRVSLKNQLLTKADKQQTVTEFFKNLMEIRKILVGSFYSKGREDQAELILPSKFESMNDLFYKLLDSLLQAMPGYGLYFAQGRVSREDLVFFQTELLVGMILAVARMTAKFQNTEIEGSPNFDDYEVSMLNAMVSFCCNERIFYLLKFNKEIAKTYTNPTVPNLDHIEKFIIALVKKCFEKVKNAAAKGLDQGGRAGLKAMLKIASINTSEVPNLGWMWPEDQSLKQSFIELFLSLDDAVELSESKLKKFLISTRAELKSAGFNEVKKDEESIKIAKEILAQISKKEWAKSLAKTKEWGNLFNLANDL